MQNPAIDREKVSSVVMSKSSASEFHKKSGDCCKARKRKLYSVKAKTISSKRRKLSELGESYDTDSDSLMFSLRSNRQAGVSQSHVPASHTDTVSDDSEFTSDNGKQDAETQFSMELTSGGQVGDGFTFMPSGQMTRVSGCIGNSEEWSSDANSRFEQILAEVKQECISVSDLGVSFVAFDQDSGLDYSHSPTVINAVDDFDLLLPGVDKPRGMSPVEEIACDNGGDTVEPSAELDLSAAHYVMVNEQVKMSDDTVERLQSSSTSTKDHSGMALLDKTCNDEVGDNTSEYAAEQLQTSDVDDAVDYTESGDEDSSDINLINSDAVSNSQSREVYHSRERGTLDAAMDVEPLFEMINHNDHTQSTGNDMEQSEVIFGTLLLF